MLNSAKRRPRCRARGGMQEQQSALSCCCYWWVSTPRVLGSVDIPNNFWRFLAQELENVWLFRHCTSEQKFKSIFWIFPVKTKMQMNLFDFTCQDTKFKSTLSKSKFGKPLNIDHIVFLCQNTNLNKFVWIFTSKQKFKSICWIFQNIIANEFSCQN